LSSIQFSFLRIQRAHGHIPFVPHGFVCAQFAEHHFVTAHL
jgi:hypothetical protein